MDVGAVVGLIILSAFIVGIIATLAGWDRYHSERPKPGSNPRMERTTEAFIDPTTGRTKRVYHDPTTGEREYRDD